MGYLSKSFLAVMLMANALTAALPPLMDVKIHGNTLTALPGQGRSVQAEALKVVEATECNHKVVGKNRIDLVGACEYLAVLYHYVPTEAKKAGATQVTGGFAFTRKNQASYTLAVAKAVEVYSPPQVRVLPLPEGSR